MSIVIEQDYETEDGEVGSPVATFWTVGHGHDASEVIHAVVEHCLEWGYDVPRVDADSGPVEMWQTTVSRYDWVEYRRAATRDGLPPYTRAADIVPITLLDLDARTRGAARCSVKDCAGAFRQGVPVRVVTSPDSTGLSYVSVTVWLCREHVDLLPEPYYRMAVIPVGAEIVLPKPDEAAAP